MSKFDDIKIPDNIDEVTKNAIRRGKTKKYQYKKVTKVSEGYSKVYNADYKGTSFENFVSLQPGEERIVTVAYLGMRKYQSKGYSSSEGVLFTDIPTLENVYMKTYAIGNIQEEEPLICLNIKNGKVVNE